MKKTFKDQRGTAVVLFVLMFTVICGISGLVVDLGYVFYNKHKLQNAVDAAALAAAQQLSVSHSEVVSNAEDIAQKNGVAASELTITHPYNEDAHSVEIVATRTLDYFFMPMLSLNSTTISARAVAKKTLKTISGYNFEAFEYAVFSNSTTTELAIKGNSSIVNGNVHANNNISVSGNKHTINGDVTANGTISLGTTTVNGTVTKYAPTVPIPAFDFNEFSNMADQVFNQDVTLNGVQNIEGIWLINGNCHISGTQISGKGIILATGEITISGSLEYITNPSAIYKLQDGTISYITYGDLLALYSLTNIRISGVNSNISGILYAPNGQIRIDGSGNSFNGALIANEVIWATNETTINGSYDLRAPQAFTTTVETIALVE